MWGLVGDPTWYNSSARSRGEVMLEGSAYGLKHIFLDLPGMLLSFPVGA